MKIRVGSTKLVVSVLAATVALAAVPMSAEAARPGTASEKRALKSAFVKLVCGTVPTKGSPCKEDGDYGIAMKDVRFPMVSVSQMRAQDYYGYPGAAVVTFSQRDMVFISDNSFQGGRWIYEPGSRWHSYLQCLGFVTRDGRVSDFVDLDGGDPAFRDAALPVLRLYGNVTGRCPVRQTPRPGVKPGWTKVGPVSTCAFYGKKGDLDGLSPNDFMSFKITGPGAASFCTQAMTVFTRGTVGATISRSPFTDAQTMADSCRFEIGSAQLGAELRMKLAPATYTIDIQIGTGWIVQSDYFILDRWHTCWP